MRRIAERHTLIDERGYAWEAQISVPWDDRSLSHGPEEPLVVIETPDDPMHWAYGEPGITLNVSYLKTVVALAEKASRP